MRAVAAPVSPSRIDRAGTPDRRPAPATGTSSSPVPSAPPGLSHTFGDMRVSPPPLRVAPPDSPSEVEARRLAPRLVAGMAAEGAHAGGMTAPRRLASPPRAEPGHRGHPVPPPVAQRLEGSLGGGAPLPPWLEGTLPQAGPGGSGIRVHADSAARADSRALGARAFAFQRHIFLGAGASDPGTPAGALLLAHEAVHALQAPEGVVSRTPATATEPPPPRAATPAEAREFVEILIHFIELGRDRYQPSLSGFDSNRAPVYTRPPLTSSALQVQLDGWKSSVENGLQIIAGTLGGDAALEASLRSVYPAAVDAAVRAAAEHARETPHRVFDRERTRILPWAWPQASLDPAGSALSDALGAAERSRIRVVTTGVTLGNVDAYFAANAAAVPLPAGHTLRFGGTVPRALRDGLSRIAGTLAGITDGLELNTTLTLGLDLGRVGGDYDAWRFTRVEHPAVPARRATRTSPAVAATPATQEILVEHLGAIGLERTAPGGAREQGERFVRLGLRLGSGWPSSPDWERSPGLQTLAMAIAPLSDAVLGRLSGLTVVRASASSVDPSRAGEYDFGSHTVRLFDGAFDASLTRFGTPGADFTTGAGFTVRHEFAHVLDQLPLRSAMTNWNASVDALNAQVDRQDAEFGQFRGRGNRYRIPPEHRAAWNALQADIRRAQGAHRSSVRARNAARSASGARLVQRTGTNVYQAVQGPVAAGSIAFRRAAVQDGVRITEYSDESWLEYFAEAWALFVSAPGDLLRLRPHIHAYFVANPL
jgi:hypothetical protein